MKGKRIESPTFHPCKPCFIVGKQGLETKASWEIFRMKISVKWWLLNRGSIFAVEQCNRNKDNGTKMFDDRGRDVMIRGSPT